MVSTCQGAWPLDGRAWFGAGWLIGRAVAWRSATGWLQYGLVGAHRCASVGQQLRGTADGSGEIQACEGSEGFATEL